MKNGYFQLQTRISIRGFVHPSVRPSVRPSVHEHESKSGKTSVLEAFCVLSVLEWGLGGAFGVDGGWLPLPTRPQ